MRTGSVIVSLRPWARRLSRTSVATSSVEKLLLVVGLGLLLVTPVGDHQFQPLDKAILGATLTPEGSPMQRQGAVL